MTAGSLKNLKSLVRFARCSNMGGKRGKKHRPPLQRSRGFPPLYGGGDDDDNLLPSSAYDPPGPQYEHEDEEEEEEEESKSESETNGDEGKWSMPSKFELYQKSVQSPKGDISYMLKFFLMYVGGRMPLHLQEDFCGTALLSSEWIHSDPRRTAVGVDLDKEALTWSLENNFPNSSAYSRVSLFHGNVLKPQGACLVKHMDSQGLSSGIALLSLDSDSSGMQAAFTASTIKEVALPAKDIVCAFNYSCCCLQRRVDLVLYFRYALNALSKKGGIFVMDIYGGISSERKLRLQRKFSNFTYAWEQTDFDIINRRTTISLHFQVGKKQTMRHAFSYDWRLWSLSEIKDCLEEAGFLAVHFWIQQMPNTEEIGNAAEYRVGHDVKYEELSSCQQQDAWNAYIVAIANL